MRLAFRNRRVAALLLVGFSYLHIFPRYVSLQTGASKLPHNVVNVWLPLARSVLAGGDLYVSHWDNKPPLFQFVNLFAAWTDYYVPVFLVLLATANAVTALAIWELCRRHDSGRVGFLAATFFLAAAPGLLGMTIDPRQFANVLTLVAFLAGSAPLAGVAIASAGLFSQYSVFLIPVIAWYHARNREDRVQWFVTFCVAGLLTVLGSFLVIALVWGVDAAMTGVRYSFFSFSEYTAKYTNMGFSAFGDPVRWTYYVYRLFTEQYVLLVAVAFGVLATISDVLGSRTSPLSRVALLSAALLSLPILIRPVPLYYFATLPFCAILGAIGVQAALDRQTSLFTQ